MNKAVFCSAKNIEQAEHIVSQLKQAGFSNNDISVLFPDKTGTQDFAHEKHTKAAIGGTTGIGPDAALGWLAGIGSLTIPGVGPFIAAGPILGTLSGAAIGATTGSLTGDLIGLGIPEYEAKRYEGKIRGGSALISVHTESSEELSKATEIFGQAHAEDIASTSESGVTA